jgi:hypothetical protein
MSRKNNAAEETQMEDQMEDQTETVEQPVAEAAPVAAEKTTKSIVPAKYAGKYKGGGSDPLAEFIKSQSTGKDGFEFTAFFTLCRKNGLPEDKVAHYESQVAEKLQGANGRARMTLRNMLATIARKNGKLIALNGEEVEVAVAKPAVSGAAAAAQASAATEEQTSAE